MTRGGGAAWKEKKNLKSGKVCFLVHVYVLFLSYILAFSHIHQCAKGWQDWISWSRLVPGVQALGKMKPNVENHNEKYGPNRPMIAESCLTMRPYTPSSRYNMINYHPDAEQHFPTFPQMTLTQFAFVLSTLTVFVVYWMNGQRQGRKLPPGPTKYPLVGSLLSMPRTLEWETFAKWGQEHSP